MKTASWIVRDKETKQVVCELFDPALVAQVNTTKYETVPILDYLQDLNRRIKAGELNA